MDLIALLAAGLVWQGGTEIAVGGGLRGAWRQNESRYDYVDDPAVAIDAGGEVSVAWVDQARKDVYLRTAGRTVNVSRSPQTFSWLPKIARTDEAMHVLWQEIIFSGGSHGGEILYAGSVDGGKSFSAPINLSESIAGDGKGRTSREHWHNGSLDIAAGPGGTVVAAWTEYEGRLLLALSKDAGRTFSAPRHLAGGDRQPARAPSLAFGPDGNVYIAWTTGEIRVARSTDRGETFREPRVIAASRAYADAPKIALDDEGELHLAFSEAGRVLYSRGAGTPRPIAPGAFPALALGAEGTVYLLWELDRGLGFALSRDGGNNFSITAPIPESAGRGENGGLQGRLMDKLAVNRAGQVAIVNSSFRPGKDSRIWLMRLSPR